MKSSEQTDHSAARKPISVSHRVDWRYLSKNRAELVIAISRCVLAAFSLLAISLDPSQPSRYTSMAYGMMAAYAVYSLLMAIMAWRIHFPDRKFGVFTHVFDLVIYVVFMFLTKSATSPFFVYFTFAVLSATVRWHWRASLYTAIIILAAYLGLPFHVQNMLHESSFELNVFVVRGVYLAVIATLLIFMGAYQQQTWNSTAALAAGPQDVPTAEPALIKLLLEHASTVLGAPRALMVWEKLEDPWLNVASWSQSEFQLTRENPDILCQIVAEPLVEQNFLCFSARLLKSISIVQCDSGHGFRYYNQGPPLAPELFARYAMNCVLALRLEAEHFQGRLLILDKRRMTYDDLVAGKIVADQIAKILNQHYVLRQLRQAVILEERMHLVRDLHDGLLQSLAAIGIKAHTLDRLIDRDPPLAHKELFDIQRLAAFEQRDLRCLIQELKPFGTDTRGMKVSFHERLSDLVEMIEDYWKLQVKFTMRSNGLTIPAALVHEAYFIIREALVNSAKHADASTLCLDVAVDRDEVSILVVDDGCGFPYHGHYDHAALFSMNLGPVTIRERVAALGGTLVLDSKDSGTRLKIVLQLER